MKDWFLDPGIVEIYQQINMETYQEDSNIKTESLNTGKKQPNLNAK